MLEPPRLLLYLNETTWVGEAGERLAALVRAARSKGVEALLVHENDRAEGRGGCEFSHLFTTTPKDLIDDGLYTTIAIALYAPPHRAVSLALVAQACGGVAHSTKHMTAAQRKEVKQVKGKHMHLGETSTTGKHTKAAKVDLREVQRDEVEQFRQEELRGTTVAAEADHLEAAKRLRAAMAAAKVVGGPEASNIFEQLIHVCVLANMCYPQQSAILLHSVKQVCL